MKSEMGAAASARAQMELSMTLDEYVKNCIAAYDCPTAWSVTLSGALVSKFRNLRGKSETRVAEHGVHIFWNSVSNTLYAGDEEMGGGKTAVDLKTSTIHKNAAYIGDCHTHPYKQKMGTDARIGPSTGDYMEWWYYPPTNFHIALHFVVSSATIFLLMMRAKTARVGIMMKGQDVNAAFDGVTADTSSLRVVQEKSMNDDGFNREYVRAFERDDYSVQRELYDRHFPTLARDFSEANLRMNLDLARKLHFEYFVGEMDSGTSALPTCNLQLKSEMVYGSFFTQAALSFKRNPTLI